MRPCDVSRALAALIPTRRPLYLWGGPGQGKSSVVKQAAHSLKLDLVDVRATLLDPVDLRGLSACLVQIVESLGGTRLRPTGAVYWIPGPRLDDWAAVARAVEQTSDGRPSAVYVLRHRLDPDAVRAIRDAVVAEVRVEAGRIRDEVSTGDLGGRALETRKRQATELRDKVLLYEDLLSVGLTDLHRVLDAADQATATAALLLGS